MGNKLRFEHGSHSSTSRENTSSKGLIASAEEVRTTDKQGPVYSEQQRLIKRCSHICLRSHLPQTFS